MVEFYYTNSDIWTGNSSSFRSESKVEMKETMTHKGNSGLFT